MRNPVAAVTFSVCLFLVGCARPGVAPVDPGTIPNVPSTTEVVASSERSIEATCYVGGMGYLAAKPLLSFASRTPLLKENVKSAVVTADSGIVSAYDACVVAASIDDPMTAQQRANDIILLVEEIRTTVLSATTQARNETAVATSPKIDKSAAYTDLGIALIVAGVEANGIYQEARTRLSTPSPITADELTALGVRIKVPL